MTTHGPNEEFVCERRRELLSSLQDLLRRIHPQGISSTTWAGLWLADIEILEALLDPNQRTELFRLLDHQTENVALLWQQLDPWKSRSPSPSAPQSPLASPRGSPSQSSPLHRSTIERQAGLHRDVHEDEQAPQPTSQPATPPAKRQRRDSDRSSTARRQCLFRDENRCLITKSLDPVDAAHIFPHSLKNSFSIDNKKHLFWALLQLFWTERRVNTWMAAAFPRGTTEVVENLLCFAPTIYRWHSKGLFGLQPIRRSDDGKEFTVKFYWLPLRKPAAQGVDLLTDPTIPEDLVGIAKDYRAWNTFTGEEIASGREIVLTTRDPENLPLPSWDLLDLQWTLQRLVALRGAADVFADTIDDDDSSGIMWEDEDENVRHRDSIASSSDQEIEPLSLSPQAPKVVSTTSNVIDVPADDQALA
ncbi:TPA_exp: Uncharacterized protein A8136_5637 [Trichophyton benhamiae CBS 112371]|uniref:HNH nuclease domain-containing protein n=1 Tax=Arthroderma benhamiae (strain ATCC MYA-4681 / CBS 112371) TaxID=663331 RepID=D4AP23_ARTBC|nr:uncharacterized protein ARB_05990 [Trichophyton benhamiae CBS 112371]EFE35034.1 hypothetical protein ARB_05990 [Trichophyton benhamiae CBS 112371]DAA77934.1 TPA_exp: Uncharacterized protein A8136_5637 [Trichophyton benhamiae CBS 112371]